jgi:hypothetical protein
MVFEKVRCEMQPRYAQIMVGCRIQAMQIWRAAVEVGRRNSMRT